MEDISLWHRRENDVKMKQEHHLTVVSEGN